MTAPARPAARDRVLPSLTSLRWFAAASVVLYHLAANAAPVAHRTAIQHTFYGGATGVSFFFVLSGFVLMWSASATGGARAFYRRRFARVYPNHVVTWAVAIPVVTFLGIHTGVFHAALALVLLNAWVPRTPAVFAANPVSWTLSCEAFFYLVFPLLQRHVGRLSRSSRNRVLMLLVFGPAALQLVVRPAPFTTPWFLLNVFPPIRLPEFVAGMLLAVAVQRREWPPVRPRVGAVLAIAGVLGIGQAELLRRAPLLTVCAYFVLIGAVATADVRRRPVLAGASLQRLGNWSYALYLVHYPLMTLVLQHVTPRRTIVAAGVWLTVAVLATLGAAALYYLWERPLERRIRGGLRPEETRPTRQPRASTASGAGRPHVAGSKNTPSASA